MAHDCYFYEQYEENILLSNIAILKLGCLHTQKMNMPYTVLRSIP